ncbi:MAG TPA: glutamate formimidoyltransferase, partial [Thermoleophilia bacterium]|nr:glutamate formimidoyltransferase [Thermoleophilia bacterium]
RELAIPVYLYEEAALRPEHRTLADFRGRGFEELREAITTDPVRQPDEGEARVHPTAGAVAIGARAPLIAFNVNLRSGDVDLARRIAGEIRERDGGLPKLKAIGLVLADGRAQVSMNLTDYRATSVLAALEAVRTRAQAVGVEVDGTEIVGLLPQNALVGLARDVLKASGLGREQVLEARVLDILLA